MLDKTTYKSVLERPGKAYELSYEQLEQVLVRFPYCQSVRMLLIRKLQADESIRLQDYVQLAAAYAPDRNFLHRWLHAPATGNTISMAERMKVLNQAVEEPEHEVLTEIETAPFEENALSELELGSIFVEDTLEDEAESILSETQSVLDNTVAFPSLQNIEPEAETYPETDATNLAEELAALDQLLDINTAPSPQLEEVSLAEEIVPDNELEAPELELVEQVISEEEHEATPESPIETIPTVAETPVAEKKTSFASFLNKLKRPAVDGGDTPVELSIKPAVQLIEPQNVLPEAPLEAVPMLLSAEEQELDQQINSDELEFPEVKQLARKSLELPADLVSEPLAQLLHSQGYHEAAIKMFEKLCLLIPNNSRYFASQIEKINPFVKSK
jgi:hypothetical protein